MATPFRRTNRLDVERAELLRQPERAIASEYFSSRAVEIYRLHPLQFVQETFGWGMGRLDKSDGPLLWQRDFLLELEACLTDGQAVHRLAISSGKGVGKTAVAAWLFLWHVACHEGRNQTTATSVTGIQTASRFWREVRIWHGLWTMRDQFTILQREMRHVANPSWIGINQTWNEGSTEGFQGLHEQYTMYLVDEASGIPDSILETIDSGATDQNVLIIYFSNPTRTTGRFREAFRRYSADWLTYNIDAREVPIVSSESVARALREANGDIEAASFRMNVRGLFPLEGHDQTIPEHIIAAARARFTELPALEPRAPISVGIDLARQADHRTCFCVRQGNYIYELATYPKQEPEEVLEALRRLIQRYAEPLRPLWFYLFGGGYNLAVVDLAGKEGIRIGQIMPQPVNKVRFADRRSELWYELRSWLREHGCLPDNRALCDQLENCYYTYNGDQQLIESKDQVVARGLPSPDMADALAASFGYAGAGAQLMGMDLSGMEMRQRSQFSRIPGSRPRYFLSEWDGEDGAHWSAADAMLWENAKQEQGVKNEQSRITRERTRLGELRERGY